MTNITQPKTGQNIVQTDLPNDNFLCSLQENALFSPQVPDQMLEGYFCNTHHPTESDNVSWVSAVLDWERQASAGYNILDAQVASPCLDGTTTEFAVQNSATISADASNAYVGPYSLKVVTGGAAANEGFMNTPYNPARPKQTYTVCVWVKGSGTINLQLFERDHAGVILGNTNSATVTLTSGWQRVSVSRTVTNGVQVSFKIVTASQQVATFYVGAAMICEGTNTTWISGPPNPYQALISLYGLTAQGSEQLIGEQIFEDLPATQYNESVIFDLKGSESLPPFTKAAGQTANTYIQLNLPFRWQNYQSVTLNRCWLSGWNKRKTSVITGATGWNFSGTVLGPFYIPYVSGMNADFSDLRFAYWDGTNITQCCYQIWSKVNSSWANVFVVVPSVPPNPINTNLYMFYGNPSATSQSSSSLSGLIYFDDFEDGKYTGRSSPYISWSVAGGTASIINSGQISGGYSLKHTGANTGTGIPMNNSGIAPTAYIVDFDFKLSTQGSGADDPYIALWNIKRQDGSNWLRLDTTYNGTSQVIRLTKAVAGTMSTVASFTWRSGKWPVNEQHHFKVICNGSNTANYITVIMDSTRIFNSVSCGGFTNTMCGVGCLESAAGIWDNIVVKNYMGGYSGTTGPVPTIGSWSSEESTTVILPDNCDWVDNFEDGKYNARNIVAREWTNQYGTTMMESTVPISGNYSLKHIGSGTGAQNDMVSINETSTDYTVEFDVQIQSQGSLTYAPYLYLWFIRFTDSNNWLRVDTYWDSATLKQKLRLIKMESGVATVIQSIDWISSKLDTGSIHHFKIIDNGFHATVFVDNVQLLDTDYTTSISSGIKGVGCPLDTIGLFDNFVFNSNSINMEATSLMYKVPSDWTAGSPCYVEYAEVNSTSHDTPHMPVSNQNILQLGYDNVSKYDALRFKVDVTGDDDLLLRVKDLKYTYEVI